MVTQPTSSPPAEAPKAKSVGFSYTDEAVKRIAQLYGDPTFADVTFVVQYEDRPAKRFVGHRNILSCWSDPLDAMLCGSFSEGTSSEVRIWDVEPDAFEVMLKMMYSGQVNLTVDNVLAVLDAGARFDVEPLVQFCVQFMQNHTSVDQACMMLEVGVQYGLLKLMDKCIELIVTDDHILESEEFKGLSQASVIELAKHDSWNMHEDDIYDKLLGWARANGATSKEQETLAAPILKHIRFLHMSVEKLKQLTDSELVPNNLIFEALFFKLNHSGADDTSHLSSGQRPRQGSRLFSWVPTSKVTVSGDFSENTMHTSANGFTGVRGDRRMQQGVYSWNVQIVETQSSWIFVGIAQADDPNDVAWRSSGRMLYCLDARFFHQGSGQNHPTGDRKIYTNDCIRVILDCQNHTLAFGVNNERPLVLFQDLPAVAYVPAVDLRDCGDKVRLVSDVQPRFSKANQPPEAEPAPEPGTDVRDTAGRRGIPSTHTVESLLSDSTTEAANDAPADPPGRERPASLLPPGRERHVPDPAPSSRAQQPSGSGVPSSGGNTRGSGRGRAAARPAQPMADSLLTASSVPSSSDAHTSSSNSLRPAPEVPAAATAPRPLQVDSLLAPESAPLPPPPLPGSVGPPEVAMPRMLSGSEVQAALTGAPRPQIGGDAPPARPPPAEAGGELPQPASGPGQRGTAQASGRLFSGSEVQAALSSDLPSRRRPEVQPLFGDPRPPPAIDAPAQSAGPVARVRGTPFAELQPAPADLPPGRLFSGEQVQAALTSDLPAAGRSRPLTGSEVQAALSSTAAWAPPLSGNEVQAALGLSHPPSAAGSSYARMSQPRQSQGSLGSTSAAWGSGFNDRGAGLSLLEPLSLLADPGEPQGPGEVGPP